MKYKSFLIVMTLALSSCASNIVTNGNSASRIENLYTALRIPSALDELEEPIYVGDSIQRIFEGADIEIVSLADEQGYVTPSPIDREAVLKVFIQSISASLSEEELTIALEFYSRENGYKIHSAIVEAEKSISAYFASTTNY